MRIITTTQKVLSRNSAASMELIRKVFINLKVTATVGSEPGKEFFLIRPRDYAKWITPQSQGLTEHGLTKLSESIRLYTRLLLGSQFQGRASILGSSAKNTSVRQLYLQEFESIIKRPESLDSDLNEFVQTLEICKNSS